MSSTGPMTRRWPYAIYASIAAGLSPAAQPVTPEQQAASDHAIALINTGIA